MFSTCPELTPCAPIPDGRIKRIMQPCNHACSVFDRHLELGSNLQSEFAIRIAIRICNCNQNLQLEFAIRICNQNLQSEFAIRICNQNLQSAATEVENLKRIPDQRLQTLVPTTAVIFRSTNGNKSCSSTLFNVGKSMGLLRQEAEFLNLFSCPLFRFVP